MRVIDCVKENRLSCFFDFEKKLYQGNDYVLTQSYEDEVMDLLRQPGCVAMIVEQDTVETRALLIPTPDFLMIGYFESTHNSAACHKLFETAQQLAKSLGLPKILGPINGDTWHRYRINLGPPGKPFLMEPYNPHYYAHLWECYGFHQEACYYSRHISDIESLQADLAGAHQRTMDAGYQYRCMDMARFDQELDCLYDLSCAAFTDNFLYTKISRPAFKAMYTPFKKLIDPNLIVVAENNAHEPVGYFFALPNYFDAIQAYLSSASWLKPLRFLWHKYNCRTINCKTTAVIPSCRNQGLASAMQYVVYQQALKSGYTSANLCLIHQDNVSDNINKRQGSIVRRYALYGLQVL